MDRNVRSKCRCSCVLQFTRRRAVCSALHRPTSQVIHRSGLLRIKCRSFLAAHYVHCLSDRNIKSAKHGPRLASNQANFTPVINGIIATRLETPDSMPGIKGREFTLANSAQGGEQCPKEGRDTKHGHLHSALCLSRLAPSHQLWRKRPGHLSGFHYTFGRGKLHSCQPLDRGLATCTEGPRLSLQHIYSTAATRSPPPTIRNWNERPRYLSRTDQSHILRGRDRIPRHHGVREGPARLYNRRPGRVAHHVFEEQPLSSIHLLSVNNSNDPSAGSPTETLLRLLLPLNDQVWSSFQQHQRLDKRTVAHRSEDLTKSFNR